MDISFSRTITPGTVRPDAELGFGRFFTDHMFTAEWTRSSGWHNGMIRPFGRLPLSPAAGGLQYAQQAFEGMLAVYGVDGKVRLFRERDHFQRLAQSANYLEMECPTPSDLLQGINELIRIDQRFIPRSPGTGLYLRPVILAANSFLGIGPPESQLLVVIASPTGPLYGNKMLTLNIELELARATRGGLGMVKTGANYLQAARATKLARDLGCDQVLWTDPDRHESIDEAGTMNFFAHLRDGADEKIVTPTLTDTILNGVTRASVLKILQATGYTVEVTRFTVAQLVESLRAKKLLGAFGTGTAATIAGISGFCYRGERLEIEEKNLYEPAQFAYRQINGIKTGEYADPFGWTTMVPL